MRYVVVFDRFQFYNAVINLNFPKDIFFISTLKTTHQSLSHFAIIINY